MFGSSEFEPQAKQPALAKSVPLFTYNLVSKFKPKEIFITGSGGGNKQRKSSLSVALFP
jgi:hypothetical protein